MIERVIYQNIDDMKYCTNIDRIETLEIPDIKAITINDAIEYYHLRKCFDKCKKLERWSDEQYKGYKQKVQKLNSLYHRFFNDIEESDILNHYEEIEILYNDTFWELFDNFKLHDKVSNEAFNELIHKDNIAPDIIFSYKSIVEKYGLELKNYLLEYPVCIRMILNCFYDEHCKIIIPKEFSNEEFNDYLIQYIQSDHVHPNTLERIINIKNKKPFEINDKIRLQARRRYEKEIDIIMSSDSTVLTGNKIIVELLPKQEDLVQLEINGNEIHLTFDSRWLLQNTMINDILAIFIYVFNYVDKPQMRSNHVNKVTSISQFESMLMDSSKLLYRKGQVFDFNNTLSFLQIRTYYYLLNRSEIRLEERIEKFFEKYIKEEFGCSSIKIKLPSKHTSFNEKCSVAIAALESILRQYNLYVEDGEIDYELLSMSSKSISIESVKSLIKDKYVYIQSDKIFDINMLLFSNKSTLLYIEKFEYESFVEMIQKEKVFINDFTDLEKDEIEKLVNNKIIEVLSDGRIVFSNLNRLSILKDLYLNEVINKHNCSQEDIQIINDLVTEGLLKEENTLLSKQEADYLDYLLNNRKYVNGPQLRNKYAHGCQQGITDEQIHEENYFVILNIIILLMIKINDDLCLNYKIQNPDD